MPKAMAEAGLITGLAAMGVGPWLWRKWQRRIRWAGVGIGGDRKWKKHVGCYWVGSLD